jgi:hypothetical protein
VPVAVNVSPMQLLDQGFPQLVQRLLRETGIPPACLTLEITESAAVENLASTQAQLRQLRELGIEVAMDDFGTGFSSLSMLRELPLSTLKIDRGLIAPLPAPDAVAVVRAICQLASALDLQVVAEGIETLEQAVAARDAGCHALQGYYHARPLAVADAGEWLQRQCGAAACVRCAAALGVAGAVAAHDGIGLVALVLIVDIDRQHGAAALAGGGGRGRPPGVSESSRLPTVLVATLGGSVVCLVSFTLDCGKPLESRALRALSASVSCSKLRWMVRVMMASC